MKNRIVADLDRTEPACKMSDRYAGWGSPFLIFMQLAGWLPALHGQISWEDHFALGGGI